MTDPFSAHLGAGRHSNPERETAHELRQALAEVSRLRERLRGTQRAAEALLGVLEMRSGGLSRVLPRRAPGEDVWTVLRERVSSLHRAVASGLLSDWLVTESDPDPCSSCGGDMRGAEIPFEQQSLFGATHFTRREAVWDEGGGSPTGWRCPDCGHDFPAVK